jgi:hypothetical protein
MNDGLTFSTKVERSGVFTTYYKGLFGEMLVQAVYQDDMAQQRRGIDKVITLADRTLTVDEKVDMYVRPTIFLEFWSNFERRKKGWFFTSEADYTLYVYPDGGAFWIPMPAVRQAWTEHAPEWLEKYGDGGQPHAIYNEYDWNGTHVKYTAFGLGVPTWELMGSMKSDDSLWPMLADPRRTRMQPEQAKVIEDIATEEKRRTGRSTNTYKASFSFRQNL